MQQVSDLDVIRRLERLKYCSCFVLINSFFYFLYDQQFIQFSIKQGENARLYNLLHFKSFLPKLHLQLQLQLNLYLLQLPFLRIHLFSSQF